MACSHRGVSGMELTADDRDPATVRKRFDCLTDAYRWFQTGACPSQSAADVAAVIFSAVCGLPGEDIGCSPASYCRDSSVELASISVTLVEKITSSLTSQSLAPAVALYYEDVTRLLFQDLHLMSRLVHYFQAEDQIISHLAAKSVSTCVVYHLHKSVCVYGQVSHILGPPYLDQVICLSSFSGASVEQALCFSVDVHMKCGVDKSFLGDVSPVWKQKCLQTFHSSPPGNELDACLWSLTEVLKKLLKGAHQELFGKLLAAFDSSLCALCSKFLPEERKDPAECVMDFPSGGHWGTTLCLLLDLMEVLTASSLICAPGVCLRSQRLTHIHSSALLKTISYSSKYFVKKRALLLLKRAVLQKAGEDWALDEALFTGLKHEHLSSDMSLLAQSVLTAVAADWLQCVQVDSASFFGGTRHIKVDEPQKPDCVMLRAVSLLLLKSMELHIQTTAGVDSTSEVYGYLQRLWVFLKKFSVQLMEVSHLCCWFSLLFGEQDDDMMEAAKALLSIFLHHRLCSGLEDVAVLEAACASGSNPHCHFLLLLQSISFDHSILLDFLISTETCFLEYFVRYLKYLRADWQGFTAACRQVSVSDCPPSLQKSRSASCAGMGGRFAPICKGEPDRVEFSPSVQPTGAVSPLEMTSLAGGLRLVEYASSDESDPENMDSQDEPGMSRFVKSGFRSLDVKQENRGPPEEYQPVLQSGQTSCLNMEPLSGQVTCETFARAVHCLSELRELVMRLQTKKLFPYNPSSLLKLLAQVHDCSQQSCLSHFNKH